MNKVELVEKVWETFSYLKKGEVRDIVESVMTEIEDALVSEGEVKLSGFGQFSIVNRDARKARNPKTGETVDVPAKKAIKFKVSSTLKAKVQ